MLRLLLSFLALMSGLAAAGTGSEARAYEARPAVAQMWQDAGAARVSAHVVAHAREVARPVQPLALVVCVPFIRVAYAVPVRVKVDRARE